jgi:hypothetical protein
MNPEGSQGSVGRTRGAARLPEGIATLDFKHGGKDATCQPVEDEIE